MRDVVYVKTDAGKHELSQRGKVPQRLRTLLVMIDGQRPAGAFVDSMKGLGVTEESFVELEKLGLIAPAGKAVAATTAPPTSPVAPAAPAATTAPALGTAESRDQVRELHAFFNETLRDALGLRGFTFQLKVERANTVEDFRALRDPYIEAVRKNKGDVIANAFATRLDSLLKG